RDSLAALGLLKQPRFTGKAYRHSLGKPARTTARGQRVDHRVHELVPERALKNAAPAQHLERLGLNPVPSSRSGCPRGLSSFRNKVLRRAMDSDFILLIGRGDSPAREPSVQFTASPLERLHRKVEKALSG